MKFLTALLIALLIFIQYPLWIGKGSWLRVWDLSKQVQAQREVNEKQNIQNRVLEAEVNDLKQGLEAIEERARYELGMVKPGEVFFEVYQPSAEQ